MGLNDRQREDSRMALEGIRGPGALANLVYARQGRTKRQSTWDRTGGNGDAVRIAAGDSYVMATIQGAGCIRHIWITVNSPDPMYMRKTLLRMSWDGEAEPSVLVPLGDFFCLGHSIAQSFTCLPFTCVTFSDHRGNYGGGVAFNCYLPMPFAEGARIEAVNEGDQDIQSFYCYVDYEEYFSLPDDVLRFHAQYRQEYPTVGVKGDLSGQGIPYWRMAGEPNLSDEENYLIFQAEGRGHFIGCNLSVDNRDPVLLRKKLGFKEVDVFELTWWGEGDDMIFVDDDTWPPSLHGTGSEDYFCQAWGMHNFQGLYSGTSVNETDPKHLDRHQLTCYRFHLEDPVLFEKRIRMSIEHGHANLQSHDFSSVAYWYQTEPHRPFEPIASVNDRLPKTE